MKDRELLDIDIITDIEEESEAIVEIIKKNTKKIIILHEPLYEPDMDIITDLDIIPVEYEQRRKLEKLNEEQRRKEELEEEQQRKLFELSTIDYCLLKKLCKSNHIIIEIQRNNEIPYHFEIPKQTAEINNLIKYKSHKWIIKISNINFNKLITNNFQQVINESQIKFISKKETQIKLKHLHILKNVKDFYNIKSGITPLPYNNLRNRRKIAVIRYSKNYKNIRYLLTPRKIKGKKCDYGCNQIARYYFFNSNKWSCSSHAQKCPVNSKKISDRINAPTYHEKLNFFKDLKEGKFNCIYCGEKGNHIIQGSWKTGKPCCKPKAKLCPTYSKVNSERMKQRYKDNPELIEKQRQIGLEVHNRPDVIRRKSESMSGEKHHNWKGGIACEPYCKQWIDDEFKEWIKERDWYICQNPYCWGTSKRMALHHIDYNKKNCHPDNLIYICSSCNSRANKQRDYWTKLYIEVQKHNEHLRYLWDEKG